jgi:hypothetical protein
MTKPTNIYIRFSTLSSHPVLAISMPLRAEQYADLKLKANVQEQPNGWSQRY